MLLFLNEGCSRPLCWRSVFQQKFNFEFQMTCLKTNAMAKTRLHESNHWNLWSAVHFWWTGEGFLFRVISSLCGGNRVGTSRVSRCKLVEDTCALLLAKNPQIMATPRSLSQFRAFAYWTGNQQRFLGTTFSSREVVKFHLLVSQERPSAYLLFGQEDTQRNFWIAKKQEWLSASTPRGRPYWSWVVSWSTHNWKGRGTTTAVWLGHTDFDCKQLVQNSPKDTLEPSVLGMSHHPRVFKNKTDAGTSQVQLPAVWRIQLKCKPHWLPAVRQFPRFQKNFRPWISVSKRLIFFSVWKKTSLSTQWDKRQFLSKIALNPHLQVRLWRDPSSSKT